MLLTLSRFGKRLVRSQLAARGWAINPLTADNGQPISVLKLLMELSCSGDGGGAILQVGANDGVLDDPIRETILALQVPAVLVEPLPDLFDQLQRNYGSQTNVYFENCAVGMKSGEADIFRISREAKHLPEWVHGAASFDRSVLLKHRNRSDVSRKTFESYIESQRVPVVTIGQLLQKYKDLKFMALQIDTEGHDFQIVRSAAQAGFFPRIINYEHKHLSYDDQVDCRALLSEHGYQFISNDKDTCAYNSRTSSEVLALG